jgi:hypothetical protein
VDKYKAKDKDDPFRLMGLVIECIKTLTLKSSKAADEVLETLVLMIQFCYCKEIRSISPG